MSELQHVLRELRSFDSVSCRRRIEELEEKYYKLEKVTKKQRKLLKNHGLLELLDSNYCNGVNVNYKSNNKGSNLSSGNEKKTSNYKIRKRSYIKTLNLPSIQVNDEVQEPARMLTLKYQYGTDPIVLNDKCLFPVYKTGNDFTDTSNESDSSQ